MIASGKGPFDWVAGSPFFQAGLAGYSDAAMRLVARRHGCGYCITEAMLDHFLIHGGKGLKAAELCDADHPIAGQLMGSHPEEIAAGSKILVELDYDVVDINLACPVKKIKKKCRGGHLLSAPEEAIAILDAVAQAVGSDVPMTVKLRRGYDDSPEMADNFYRILDAAIGLGYKGVTVHGRTVQQKYIGPSKWPFLTELTKRYADAMAGGFHIFGSGDIFSPQAIFDMLGQTGVQAVSVARGCIGNPWIFQQAHQIIQGQAPTPPTIAEQRDVLLEHFELSVALHGEKQAGRMMRKFGIKFSQHHPSGEAVKDAFIRVKNLADWRAVLDEHYGEPAML
ncbi:tRNA-dihydrouridine synthase family protein [Planctomycetales bacterium ZRK34]|nr:tRNA-dihydrouridine synthase family protein [Planctomycetales bacterium ZRK34]